MSGLNGLGCEIAKNVLLGGVKSMTIHDTKETTLWDLSSQYYLSDKDVGARPVVQSSLSQASRVKHMLATGAAAGRRSCAPCHPPACLFQLSETRPRP